MKKYLKEVDTRIKLYQSKSKKDVAFLKNYMRSELQFYSVTTPVQRRLSKEGFSFSKLDFAKQVEIWNHIWKKSDHFEVKNQALFYLDSKTSPEELKQIYPYLVSWAEDLENWAHSDWLSSMLVRVGDQYPKLVLPKLQKWNRSKKPWLRRQSLVSLLYYSRMRKKPLPFETCIRLVETQIDAPEYYVQKGVGWTLRELYNVYPQKTKAFIEANLKVLSAVAFTTSVEKWTLAEKAKLKALRKQFRKRQSLK